MNKITFANGIIIRNPEDRIREYCTIEIYRGYDDRHDVNQTITWENINIANKVFARIGTVVAEKIIESKEIRHALAIIANKELGEIIDDEWINYKEKLHNLLISFCSIKGVGLAVATKILHIKRPKLIPILDSFVVKLLLGINTTNIAGKSYLADIGIRTIDVIRTDIKNNWDTFIRLRELLSDLPIPLEIVRIYDILVWTTQKWDKQGDLTAPYGKPFKSFGRESNKADHDYKRISYTEQYLETNKIWVNVDKPLRKCTIHTNANCKYALSKRETLHKGIGKLKSDGGWFTFNSFVDAENYCRTEQKGYTITKCC